MVELLGAADIRALAQSLGVVPTKKLGQNFVTDPNTIRRIVQAAKLTGSETVVEIGPGLGSLTLGLLEQAKSVIAVEIDNKMAAAIEQTVQERAQGKSFHLVSADALKVTELPLDPDALVANLPYNISVPVLLHFLEQFPSIHSGLVLVQAEVAHRLAAVPGSKVYGVPSAKLAWYANANLAGNIGRNIFWPAPNVDSALVYFVKRDVALGSEELRLETFAVIDNAFAQRRKTLRQALAEWAGSAANAEEILVRAGIDPTKRGEALTILDFVSIAKARQGQMFKKKVKDTGIFDDLPVFQSHPSTQREEVKKSGRRAMLIPDKPATADLSSDQLVTNTGRQREDWLEIIYQSAHRESKQKDISTWLQNSYRVQKWWANSIALMYLKWREAPKTNTGSDSVLRVSQRIEASASRAFSILNSEKLYGEDFKRFLKQVDSERLVLSFEDETRATITFQAAGSDCDVLVEHEFIQGKATVKNRTVFWSSLLNQVASQVSR